MVVEKRKRTEGSEESTSSVKSVLKSSDVSFPRGGGSVLTPLEVKEVANEAARDVLFEQAGSEASVEQPKKKKKFNNAKNKKKVAAVAAEDEDKSTSSIDHYNFKSLLPGSHVLGQIVQINKMDIALSLTDNIIGYVPITSISEEITAKIEEFQREDEEEGSDSESDSDEEDGETTALSAKPAKTAFPVLRKYFKPNQWLRAQVVESQSGNKSKRRIQLSIEPEVVNSALEDEDLVAGAALQASVVSVEDHGCILNCGKDKNGFISSKELKAGGFEADDLQVGSVLLTTVAKNTASARSITCKVPSGAVKKQSSIATVSSVDAVLPGVLVDALVVEVQSHGVLAKLFGVIEATVNFSHTNIFEFGALKHRFSVGSNVRARVLNTVVKGGEKKISLSLLPHVLSLDAVPYDAEADSAPLEAFPIGHVFDGVEIKGHDSRYIYADVGSRSTLGQAHVSKINDNEAVDVDYKIGTVHKARVLGYCQADNLYVLTFDKEEIKKPYLRSQDIPVGAKVTAEVLKVVPEGGISLRLFGEFDAYVPRAHISDVRLVYPERKFKIGAKVAGRVLRTTHPKGGKTNVMVTFKKSLVGVDDDEVLSKIDQVVEGSRVPVTVEKFFPAGCVVSMFGNLKAFLPKAEISETFVRRAEDHLKLGQTVKARVLGVDRDARKIRVSCIASNALSDAQKQVMASITPGQSVVEPLVVQKEKDAVVVELPGNNLRGVVPVGHLSDGTIEQCRAALKQLQVGAALGEALVLEKDARARLVNLTMKPSLIDHARTAGSLPVVFEDVVSHGGVLHGYIKSVTDSGVFVGFANRLTGLVLPKYYSTTAKSFHVHQSVAVKVLKVDAEKKRFLLTMDTRRADGDGAAAVNAVDPAITLLEQFVPGTVTKAVVRAVKTTQLNVDLADNQQGRVDISQVFDTATAIRDWRHPLAQFQKGDVIDVRIIGYHDARNHRFLPVSHRKNKHVVLELSAKKGDVAPDASAASARTLMTLADTPVGSRWTAFVNNFARSYLWVNIAPAIRGRISLMDLSDDASSFADLDKNYPLGSALEVTVEEVDTEHNALTLSARVNRIRSLDDVKVGQVVPARVLKTKDTFVLVELGKDVTASSFITDALNDYTQKLEKVFSTNDICAATVLSVDVENSRVAVSLRTKDARDKLVSSVDDLERNDVVRGFVKNVADNGVYVTLGRSVFGLVRVSDLSDAYIKDWKKFFKPHQPVIAKVVNAQEEGRVLATLKESAVNGDLNILKGFADISAGDVFEGSVKQATDFGVFVKLDGTLNVSGLCHHSEISDNAVADAKALFGEGDRVKVKVLRVNAEKKQLSLGMKASYFVEAGEDVEMEVEEEEEEEETGSEEENVEADADAGADSDEDEVMDDFEASGDSDGSGSDSDSDNEAPESASAPTSLDGLSTNGFDWTASILDQAAPVEDSDSDEDFTATRKKSRKSKKNGQAAEDKTGDLNTRAPQSVSDFERLLVGNPNSSILWMNYMSFQLQLSEIDKAREIGQRALDTINYREEQEKLNIWIALLNMENTFGTDESLDDVFKKSCQYMDAANMHEKLISVYVLSEKFHKADDLYQKALKKFGRDVGFWVSYGSFLLDQRQPERCHELLARALAQLPKPCHIEVVRKFAQLEFAKGEAEQGRSLFEGLISDVPKRIDLWNVYIDQEIKLATAADRKKVEDLFERVIAVKKLSRKQAKFFFNKWLEFEEDKGDQKACDYVKAKAVAYAERQSDK